LKKDNELEQQRILNAFPAALLQDVGKVIEILPFKGDDILLADGKIHTIYNKIHSQEQLLYLDKEELKIPYRVYFNEPGLDKEKLLTGLQKTILHCIYLRHHNGYIRQRRLERLIDNTEYFIIPFIFQLLGEYVMEILEVLEKHINPTTIHGYARFITENPKYWIQTESRMISYWNQYYRYPMYPSYLPPKYPTRKEYVGQKIVDRLKKGVDDMRG